MSVIWHDLECGGYVEDLPLWRELASRRGDPVLDVGAGTGRVALDLARRGHRVTALDRDPALVAELQRRAAGLQVHAVLADAREFDLQERFTLCLMPMQTIQLLGGPPGRAGFLSCARAHLKAGGLLAIAIAEQLEAYEDHGDQDAHGDHGDHGLGDLLAPLPDMCERDGVVYSSQPTAIRVDRDAFVLERRRETVTADGRHSVCKDRVRLDRVSPAEIEREAAAAGLQPAGRRIVPETSDYAGSTVVMLSA